MNQVLNIDTYIALTAPPRHGLRHGCDGCTWGANYVGPPGPYACMMWREQLTRDSQCYQSSKTLEEHALECAKNAPGRYGAK
jgi:hypothetical protein